MNLDDLNKAYDVDPTNLETMDQAEFLEPGTPVWSRMSPWRKGKIKEVINDPRSIKQPYCWVEWADGTTTMELCIHVTLVNMEESAGGGIKLREPAKFFSKEEFDIEGFAQKQKDKEIMDPTLLVGGGEVAKKKAGLSEESFDRFVKESDIFENSKGDVLIKKGSLGIMIKNEHGMISAECYEGKNIISGLQFSQLLMEGR